MDWSKLPVVIDPAEPATNDGTYLWPLIEELPTMEEVLKQFPANHPKCCLCVVDE